MAFASVEAPVVVLLPAAEAQVQPLGAGQDGGPLQPGVDRLAAELEEDPFAPVLGGG